VLKAWLEEMMKHSHKSQSKVEYLMLIISFVFFSEIMK
jgi:hypothetical protein